MFITSAPDYVMPSTSSFPTKHEIFICFPTYPYIAYKLL